MPQLITISDNSHKCILRINKVKNVLEVSETDGRIWSSRFTSQSCGTFVDLLYYNGKVFACTNKGLYISTNQGKTFSSRYINAAMGVFLTLQDCGKELLATTSKGLYWSVNEGITWSRR